MATLCLKPRRSPYSTNGSQQTFFLHPGYPDGHNILFVFPTVDSGGIHHETARIACAILANSRWDGFLTTTRDGEAINQGRDEILVNQRYYFRIQDDEQYPIIPSFNNFLCPTTLPDSWAASSPLIEPTTMDDVRNRDQTCRITASLVPNGIAHIIPQAQSEWWQSNSMIAYTANPELSTDTRCAENAILLRRDLHKLWDDHRFAIVPKAGKWVIHVLWKSPSEELEKKYHNLELQPLSGVARHFLFCRFALAILSKSIFLNQNVTRKLVTLDSEATPHVRSMSANEYRRLFSPARRANSRSQSPQKRQRSAQDNDEAMDEEGPVSGSDSGEEEQRGRRRRRSWLYVDTFSSHDAPEWHPGRDKYADRKRQKLHTPPKSNSLGIY
ncbi:unnamed protein product [Clonostachys rhizophaga]|uniref:HNH nuclease domain-containing protein n=1 Tax=Clonostachys rhizophaga TaxID=160324 RepID=A0A9N9YVK5_9HYPO|nr:unnamed protein product [Clonostachys rhizophaga]